MLTQKYKQVVRQSRIQTTETNFGKGMSFTNNPLQEGASRLLVNYTVDSITGVLKPRKGYYTLSSLISAVDTVNPLPVTRWYRSFIRDYKEHRMSEGPFPSTLEQYIVNSAKNSPDTRYGERYAEVHAFSTSKQLSQLTKYTTTPIVVGVNAAKIVAKSATNLVYKVPGCFAFGNSYYTFRQAYEVTSGDPAVTTTYPAELRYTKLDSEITPAETPNIIYSNATVNSFQTLKAVPQTLNPSEAANWGMNMLLENPYKFASEQGGSVYITGLLPYNKDTNEVALITRQNQTVIMKAYYRAPDAFHSATEIPITYTLVYAGEVTALENLPEASYRIPNGTYYNVSSINQYWVYYYNAWHFLENSVPAYTVPETLTVSRDTTDEDPIHLLWEWSEVGSPIWNKFDESEVYLSEHYTYEDTTIVDRPPFTAELIVPTRNVLVRLTITDKKDVFVDVNGSNIAKILSTNTTGLTVVTEKVAETLNIKPVKYDLGTASGMIFWQQRLVLWGVNNARGILFVSDVNNPAYFPYPNNVDLFNEDILNVLVYGNDLIILTATTIYRLVWSADGSGWNKQVAQNNLQITDPNIAIVAKNMLFFKSNEAYYMLVPRAGTVSGETVIAPISKPIMDLLNNWTVEIKKIWQDLFDYTEVTSGIGMHTPQLYDMSTYLDGDNICVSYAYVDKQSIANNVVLLTDAENSRIMYVILQYNTLTRTWTLTAHEQAQLITPITNNSIEQNKFVTLIPSVVKLYAAGTNIVLTDPITVEYTPTYLLTTLALQGSVDTGLQYSEQRVDRTSNFGSGDPLEYTQTLGAVSLVNATKYCKNYQYLDTGYRDINTPIKKRFRESQFNINNVGENSLTFASTILVDGRVRQTPIEQIPQYDAISGEVIITRSVLDNIVLRPGTVLNAPDYTEPLEDDESSVENALLDYWTLDYSHFPEVTLWKIRIPFSGKGYTSRLQLISKNEKPYELLSTTWVYRTLNSR